jgi:hypothetical protein
VEPDLASAQREAEQAVVKAQAKLLKFCKRDRYDLIAEEHLNEAEKQLQLHNVDAMQMIISRDDFVKFKTGEINKPLDR